MHKCFLISLILLLNNCSSSVETRTITYEHCTTKVILYWDNTVIEKRRQVMLNAFAKNVQKDLDDDVKDMPISEMGSINDYAWIYFIYDSNPSQCEDKYLYTKRSLERYLKPVNNAPAYTIIEKEISKKELNILMNASDYNQKYEIENWLKEETFLQLK